MPQSHSLEPEQVAHLAELARIALTSQEISKLTGELGIIIESIAKVSEVATSDVPATSHPMPLTNVFRQDIPGKTLTPDEALAGAPDREGDRFKVASILGDEQ
ncbi:MAG: Asp-tRNA(Asn)/Glu-tRNA(Gln) amidotransferase subunit GatC [Microbacteriaceae bacterium]|nr:Asp-tRNA(Asn)/Glu-tRNA(Gln) amidotransferase subunit GatC [Microbacteriaceae bacterium]